MGRPATMLLAALALAGALAPARPASAGPLARLAGDWTGQGTITTLTGLEHARCTARYRVEGGEAALELACTTERYALDLTGTVHERGGGIAGVWSERRFGTSGTVSGRIDAHRLTLAATVVGARVSIVVAMAPARQRVTLSTTSLLVPGGDLALARSR